MKIIFSFLLSIISIVLGVGTWIIFRVIVDYLYRLYRLASDYFTGPFGRAYISNPYKVLIELVLLVIFSAVLSLLWCRFFLYLPRRTNRSSSISPKQVFAFTVTFWITIVILSVIGAVVIAR